MAQGYRAHNSPASANIPESKYGWNHETKGFRIALKNVIAAFGRYPHTT
jgi:hypothetical protein